MLADLHHGRQLLERRIFGDVFHAGALRSILQNGQQLRHGVIHAADYLTVGLKFRVKNRVNFHMGHSFINSANNSLQAG